MDKFQEQLIQANSACFADTVQAIINRTCLVDFGIVKKVVDTGVVEVIISVATKETDIRIVTCTYATISNSVLAVNLTPTVNDKVIVLYPRRFDEDMFNMDNSDVILNSKSEGYNLLSGIAIPINQFRVNQYTKQLNIDSDGVIKFLDNDSDNFIQLDISDSSKISIEDSNGSTIETTSSSLKINGKLEIKK